MSIAIFGKQNASSEAAIDRRPADQHREFQIAPMQFIDNQWHLLGCGNQQRTQSNSGGVNLNSFRDDRLSRNLFAKINHSVAVICENRFDEILPNIMYIAIHSCDHNCAFSNSFFLFQIIFEVSDGFLHHFGGLKHERQNQLACTELITDFFHGWEQYSIENINSGFVLSVELLPSPLGGRVGDEG